MNIPPLQIGDLTLKVPIIQGGMGIGVSLSTLAAAVANEGALGVISGVQIGFREEDFKSNSKEANIRALRKEIRRAKELSPKGVIGLNLMVAMNNYEDMVKTAVEEKIDIIISGAGLPTVLPKLVKGSTTKIAPIVSSAKATRVILKLWEEKHNYIPDLIVVEGPKAGGHLGFKRDELEVIEKYDLSNILKEVLDTVSEYEAKHNCKIPVVAAGGVYSGKDIAELLSIGASGVQMGTRFIGTYECDADEKYKRAFIESKKEDIEIIQSPVGMPGRAIKNSFIKSVNEQRPKIDRCYNCLRKCDPKTTIYCISNALMEAVKGNIENGLIFTGSNGYKITKLVTVKELINDLIKEVMEYEQVN
ncbi:nitronate monooxygenase family protein [Clostridium sp. HMP27]|uniref:NAD(P)H-dependent flavin oxidoreductase n=1 Tax=Clostridium sp. HMP27 TaxID=1487921 RepID=UPI00052BCAB4|nr:nitronate monooxygenase family protein [Clostridium sp. HMP27]KGK89176.1 2-nitropropane dioxygenase [Clostridium sp. HMP27]